MNQLVWMPTFIRTARKLLRKNPALRPEFQVVVEQLEADPFHPRLRLHPLKGNLQGKHAASVTYSHRLVLLLRLEQHEIILLDVGSHDEVYRD